MVGSVRAAPMPWAPVATSPWTCASRWVRGRKAIASEEGWRDHAVMADTVTHTCPYCELVFKYHNEVKDHILHDHPEHAAAVALIEPHELPRF
jgi:hypothetical protein